MPNIVVADDDEDIRALVSFLLSSRGHDVTTVADGVEALEVCRTSRPDLVLLDVMMPRMSGLDACRALREDPDLSDVAVVLLTARSADADVEAGFGAGALDYLAKPFSPRELAARVDALLARTMQ